MKHRAGTRVLWLMAVVARSGWAQTDIGAAWDQVIASSLPQAPADPVLLQPQTGVPPGKADDFLNHFFFESRTNYERYQASFTGQPTTTGVIDAPNNGIFNPAGIPYPPAFQSSANRLYTFHRFWNPRISFRSHQHPFRGSIRPGSDAC